MGQAHKRTGMLLLAALVLVGCGSLKYAMLKGTSLPNPPPARLKVYIKEFPVESKASVIERLASVTGSGNAGGTSSINAMTEVGGGVMEIARPCNIEDLSGAVLYELSRDSVRVFTDMTKIQDLKSVRWVKNPFELVPLSSAEAQVEVSGTALIHSQRVSKKFSQEADWVRLDLTVKDLAGEKVVEREKMRIGLNLIFNSKELEQAMAVAVVTYLTQKTLF